jgi:hypothetical protein
MARAINWAYLHETQDSFAIEKEAPSENKARRFIALFRQAHERRPLSDCFDVRGSALSTLVMMSLDNDGVVSKHRRKQFAGIVPEAVFDAIENETRMLLDTENVRPGEAS